MTTNRSVFLRSDGKIVRTMEIKNDPLKIPRREQIPRQKERKYFKKSKMKLPPAVSLTKNRFSRINLEGKSVLCQATGGHTNTCLNTMKKQTAVNTLVNLNIEYFQAFKLELDKIEKICQDAIQNRNEESDESTKSIEKINDF